MKFNTINRAKYEHKATWRNPDEDVDHVIYYYYVNPLTLKVTGQFGKQMVRPTTVIGIAGQHPFVKGDVITLDNGLTLQVGEITLQYYKQNMLIKEHLIPRVEEMVVELV